MNSIRFGGGAVLVGLLAACATETQPAAKASGQSVSSTEINVTNDLKYRWGEHALAINPKNPKNIVYLTVGVGFTKDCQEHGTDCQMVPADFGFPGMRPIPQPRGIFENRNFNVVAAYSSFDGGKTWKRTLVPVSPVGHPEIYGGGDPSVAVGPDGTFYASFDANNWGTPEHVLPNAGAGVSLSKDGGRNWSAPVLPGTPVDGPKIVIDQSTGTLYESSSTNLGPHADGNPNSPKGDIIDRWLVSSKDGVHWSSPPKRLGGTDGTKQFAAHAFLSAAHGILGAGHVQTDPAACAFFVGSQQAPCAVFQATTDDGATWTRYRVPFTVEVSGPVLYTAADPTKKGHFSVMATRKGGNEFHIFQSLDAGRTWSGPAIVTEDANRVHFKPWFEYSPQGVLGIMWRTHQPRPGETVPATMQGGPGGGPQFAYDVWAAISKDGGATFSEPLKVSNQDSSVPQSGMFGNAGDDYSSIALYSDNVYVGWSHWLGDDRQGYLRAIKLSEFHQKQ